MRNVKKTSLFARAYIRDGKSVYERDAMLIAVLSHTHGADRTGADGKAVRKMLDDINLEA